MKRLIVILAAIITLAQTAVSAADDLTDEELIIRAVAASYPEAGLGAKTAICAVILNRIEADGFGDSAAAVIRAENSGLDPSLLCEKIDEKNRRITRDAYMAAVSGADPTGGMLYFEKLPEPSRSDNRVEFEEEMDLDKYSAVIGGYGFW